MSRTSLFGTVALLLCLSTAPAAAVKQTIVVVDAHSAPWNARLNPNMPFGVGDGRPPRYVLGQDFRSGGLLRLFATGAVTVLARDVVAGPRDFRSADQPSGSELGLSASKSIFAQPPDTGSTGTSNSYAPHPVSGTWGPEGQIPQIANSSTGIRGTRFPSFYVSHIHYPVRVNQLLGAFVDADGAVIGAPFPVGRSVMLRVPEGAVAITLGLNSETFAVNRGTFMVVVSKEVPRVTVEPH